MVKREKKPQPFDVIIVGSGAGGGTLARSLADTGAKILILERGDYLPIETDNWNSEAVFIKKKYRTDEHWYDKHDKPFHPNTHFWVGGNTTFYGAALMRMKERDFQRTKHYGGGVSPAWPISYDDMRPWYDEAEKLWEVHGKRNMDPYDDERAPPFPHPPLKHDPGVKRLQRHFEEQGWRPSPLPVGVRRDEDKPYCSQCIRCRTCGGYPCLLRAKVDARTAALAHIYFAKNVTILPNRKAVCIETSKDGQRAEAVIVDGPEGQERFEGRFIVASCGAAPTAQLFLKSANEAHPKGLANSSNMVGRHYMFHMTSAVISIAARKFDASFSKTMCVMDFYHGEPYGSFPFPMGQIQMLEFMTGNTLQGEISYWIPPFLIPDIAMNMIADRVISFLVLSEDLPDPNNRVTLAPDGNIKLSYTFGDTTAHDRLVERLEKGLDGFAVHKTSLLEHRFEVDSLLPLFGTAHQCGTMRFGHDPETSVVDVNCRTHDVENLYVVDTSFFPSSSAVNPTLTCVANALRVGEHMKEQLAAD